MSWLVVSWVIVGLVAWVISTPPNWMVCVINDHNDETHVAPGPGTIWFVCKCCGRTTEPEALK